MSIEKALQQLRPGASWAIVGEPLYQNIQWTDTRYSKPSQSEVEALADELQKQWENNEYQRKRAKEYPDFKQYLDGVVKGDQTQIQAYIDACLAVKEKYPKPEGL